VTRLPTIIRVIPGLYSRHTVRRTKRPIVVVASTEMTHCGPDYRHLSSVGMTAQMFAYQEDRYAIDRMLALGAKGLYEVVH
jgi:AmmeMemoRadiSam system protein B